MASKLNHILVTGGCGFIGSNFIRYWLSKKNFSGQLVNLDALTYAGNLANLKDLESDPRYRFVHGSIGQAELVAKLLRENSIDTVVNFAAETHVDRSIDTPQAFAQTNVTETLTLLRQVEEYWRQGLLKGDSFRFLHVSTDEVYGTLLPDDLPFSETTAYTPNSPYAASKAAGDHFVRAYFQTYGLPVLTTNCSNNYGPYQFTEKLIPLMIVNALAGKLLPIYGDGLQRRDWLYVGDHCAAIERVLSEGCAGETYNVGGDSEKSNLDLVEGLCEILDELRPKTDGSSYKDQKVHVDDRPGHDRRYAINHSKITDALGWKPSENFDSGLRKTVAWYLGHETWMNEIHDRCYQQQRLGVIE